MAIIGIDPGKDGGISVLGPKKKVEQFTIPKIAGTTEVDVRELWAILNRVVKQEDHVFLEQVHAIYGASAKSTFNFGHVCGMLEGMVLAKGVPYTMVQPKVWQKEVFKGVPEQRKSGTPGKKGPINTKAMALLAAKRLFPGVTHLPTPRSKKPHDGLVDSLLIAEYGRLSVGEA